MESWWRGSGPSRVCFVGVRGGMNRGYQRSGGAVTDEVGRASMLSER